MFQLSVFWNSKAKGLEITPFKYLNLENASASGGKPPWPPWYAVFWNPKAEGLEITPFEDLNLENASASGGKPCIITIHMLKMGKILPENILTFT